MRPRIPEWVTAHSCIRENSWTVWFEAKTVHDASSDFLNEWLERDYSALGYLVVKVSVLPPEERLAFILDGIPCYQKTTTDKP